MDSSDSAVSDAERGTSTRDGDVPMDEERGMRPKIPLRVMFLCGSLEPGRDGVGDYTRLLLTECQFLGSQCCVVALNDHYITQPSEALGAEGTVELRLPSTMSWPERVRRITNLRTQFQPDWVSLQFVPYAFNAKGIVWNLKRRLRAILGDLRMHLMLHELWIGASRTAGWKEKVIGMLQRNGVLRLIRDLGPGSITTSNSTYVEMLKNRGVESTKLSLFGNIPVIERNGALSWWVEVDADSASIDLRKRDRYWLVMFFGTLHPQWESEPLFSIIRQAADRVGRDVCFVSVGRLGASGEKEWSRMARQYAGTFTFVSLGEKDSETISGLLQEADFGIAASPWQLIGKSGSAIAMLEHGLPVIANRDDWHARDVELDDSETDPLLHRLDGLLEAKLIAGLAKRKPRGGIRSVAQSFTESLRGVAA